jgi:hypothetical protein
VTEKIWEEITKFVGYNKNENIIYQTLWNTAKAVLRGKLDIYM